MEREKEKKKKTDKICDKFSMNGFEDIVWNFGGRSKIGFIGINIVIFHVYIFGTLWSSVIAFHFILCTIRIILLVGCVGGDFFYIILSMQLFPLHINNSVTPTGPKSKSGRSHCINNNSTKKNTHNRYKCGISYKWTNVPRKNWTAHTLPKWLSIYFSRRNSPSSKISQIHFSHLRRIFSLCLFFFFFLLVY